MPRFSFTLNGERVRVDAPADLGCSTSALLKRKPNPSDEDIDKIENICRCGTYFRIREAIKQAARH